MQPRPSPRPVRAPSTRRGVGAMPKLLTPPCNVVAFSAENGKRYYWRVLLENRALLNTMFEENESNTHYMRHFRGSEALHGIQRYGT